MIVVGPGITLQDYESGKVRPIDVFEGQLRGWILAFANYLAHQHEDRGNSGIAVLLLTASILEPLGGVLPTAKGRKTSETKFCNGFVRVFPEVPGSKDAWQVAKRVCDLLRHGLFHEAFIKAGLALTSQNAPIVEDAGSISIDPVRFFDAVEAAVVQVCDEIRRSDAGAPMRKSFDAYWNEKEAEQVKHLAARVRPEAEYPPVCGTSTLAPVVPNRFVRKI